MMLPLLIQEDVEALENRVLASGVAGRVRGRADLGEPSIREVLERLTHSLLVVAPYPIRVQAVELSPDERLNLDSIQPQSLDIPRDISVHEIGLGQPGTLEVGAVQVYPRQIEVVHPAFLRKLALLWHRSSADVGA
ncbi:MAG TPA: hypothetical protein VMG58_14880 [Candidatus Sulfotelmatobacter sp.]|nr:hypothetical protein [Candidatus Sulfotelmatobacter sp.]